MSAEALAAIPSALPAAPGSVEEHWICDCGVEFRGPVHESVRERFREFWEEAHKRPGCRLREG